MLKLKAHCDGSDGLEATLDGKHDSLADTKIPLQTERVQHAQVQTTRPCYYRLLKCRRSVAVSTIAGDVDPMDFVYAVARNIVGEEVMDAMEVICECYELVDKAMRAWADTFHITETSVGVLKVDDEVVFCAFGDRVRHETANVIESGCDPGGMRH